jgi:hypothetical protein
MKQEKVVQVSLHQAVKIDGNLATSLSDINSRGKYRADMTLMPEIQCILAETSKDRVLVPFTNCSSIKLSSVSVAQKEEEALAEAKRRESNRKKPKSVTRPR